MADFNPPPTFHLLCYGVADRAYAFSFTGRDFTGWGIEGECDGLIFPGWVTRGDSGDITLSLPMADSSYFQGTVKRGTLWGITPDGARTVLGTLVVNALEQP